MNDDEEGLEEDKKMGRQKDGEMPHSCAVLFSLQTKLFLISHYV